MRSVSYINGRAVPPQFIGQVLWHNHAPLVLDGNDTPTTKKCVGRHLPAAAVSLIYSRRFSLRNRFCVCESIVDSEQTAKTVVCQIQSTIRNTAASGIYAQNRSACSDGMSETSSPIVVHEIDQHRHHHLHWQGQLHIFLELKEQIVELNKGRSRRHCILSYCASHLSSHEHPFSAPVYTHGRRGSERYWCAKRFA